VDDVDMIQTITNESEAQTGDVTSLNQVTQNALNQWESTLKATGGALEPSKTFCVPIITEWKGNKKVLTSPSASPELTLHGINDTRQAIRQHSPTEAFFTLGIWQSPSGDESSQLDYIKSKIQEWGVKTSLHPLTWVQARIAIKSTLGHTLTYPLTATTFNETQCKVLQKLFLHTILGKMGITRSTPALIATAPVCLGGLGILSFELTQLFGHVILLLLHGPDSTSITGQLISSSLEFYALESGLSGDPLGLPSVDYVTPNTWISQTIKSLRKYNIEIPTDVSGLQDWCKDDIFFMERMCLYFSGSVLATINNAMQLNDLI
jgi:hypothetical protein